MKNNIQEGFPQELVDKEFSELEKMAFQGEWCDKTQERIFRRFEMETLTERGFATSPEHSRLQALCAVKSSREYSKKYEDFDFSVRYVETYIERYPQSIKYLPEDLKDLAGNGLETEVLT